MVKISMDYAPIIENLERNFKKKSVVTYQHRIDSLRKLKKAVIQSQDEICLALQQDLGKPFQEALLSEVAFVLKEISFTIKRLKKWMRPKSVKTPLTLFPARSKVVHQPLGVVLIISPWNYPFQLAIGPIIGAIAAGNCILLKPSEVSSHTSKLLKKLINSTFEEDFISVVEGGVSETKELLKFKFNHIFFTGSTRVGKLIMETASASLTPVTLELGGKSPAIIDKDADLELAAKRIVWGKFFNAGQTCIAPDYLYVHKSIKSSFIEKLIKNIKIQYGENPKESLSYAKIINQKKL